MTNRRFIKGNLSSKLTFNNHQFVAQNYMAPLLCDDTDMQ